MRSAHMLMTMTLGVLSACGQDAGTGPAADSSRESTQLAQLDAEALAAVDACALLTEDELRAILGQNAVGQEETGLGFDLACYWYADARSDEQRGFGRKEVSVEVSRLEPVAALREEYNNFKENMTFREEVSGVGAEAFLAQYSLSGSALVMRTDNLLVFINTSEPDQEPRLKQLGSAVLNRLQ